jgi:hypothetical protein
MKYRKLRIAWLVGCGVLCLLLIVLWVRSYSAQGLKSLRSTSVTQREYVLSSADGKLAIWTVTWRVSPGGLVMLESASATRGAKVILSALGFEWTQSPTGFAVAMPYWLPVAITGSLAGAPYIRSCRRFSLHTLLIGMTVVAVAVAMIAWAAR